MGLHREAPGPPPGPLASLMWVEWCMTWAEGRADDRFHGTELPASGRVGPTVTVNIAAVLSTVVFLPAAEASASGAVFVQPPPFAERFWFLALLVFVTTLLVALLARWQLASHRKVKERLEHEVQIRTEEIERTSEILRRINEGIGLEEILDLVYESFRPLIPYNRIGYAELLDDDTRVGSVWTRTDADEPLIPVGFEVPIGKTSLGGVLERGEPRILNDLEAYLHDHPGSLSTRLIVKEGMRSSLTVPLRGLDRAQGFLFFSCRRTNVYTADHVRIIQRLASQLAVIIGKSRLHEELVVTTWNLEEANRRLEELATSDALTGLGNRRFFEERLEAEWRRQMRLGRSLALLMVDVDHFKKYNDARGHQEGDFCLQKISAILQSMTRRAGDVVARWGGEELAVLLPEMELEQACEVAENLRRAVEEAHLDHPASPVAPVVTISVGCTATVPTPNRAPQELVTTADAALYRAKASGRNRVEGCGP